MAAPATSPRSGWTSRRSGSSSPPPREPKNLRVTVNEDALIRGSFFRSDHFPLARAGVPALSLESGVDFVGKPKGWGEEQSKEYTEKRYHQPGDELLPWFTYDGALQQLRVVLRTAVAAADSPRQPVWYGRIRVSGSRRAEECSGGPAERAPPASSTASSILPPFWPRLTCPAPRSFSGTRIPASNSPLVAARARRGNDSLPHPPGAGPGGIRPARGDRRGPCRRSRIQDGVRA